MYQEPNENKNNSDQAIENLPVHTMQQDLEAADNPASAQARQLEMENALQRKPLAQENLTPLQKSSPFFNPASQATSAPEPIKVFPKQPAPTAADPVRTSPVLPPKKPINPGQKAHPQKTLVLILAGLIILLLAGGGYYFWTTRQQTAPVAIPEPAPQPIPTPEPAPQPVAPQFNTDKPNYLSIDPASTDANAIKNAIQSYVDKVSQANIATPVEFVVVDAQNNPVPFSVFAKNFGLKLSPGLLQNLADTFSLFIYDDQGNARLGLAVDSKNDVLLKNAVTKEEASLVPEIAPLFLDVAYTKPAAAFGKSTYDGAMINYLNVISPQQLSVDFTIFNKKLLIGTTKMTLRSMIDYTSKNTPAPTTTTPPVPVPPAPANPASTP